MSTPKKAVKKPAAKTEAGAAALTRVYKVKKQFESGVRAEFTKIIAAKGATLSELAKLAKLPVPKAKAYAYRLTANGYLTRVDA
jgi:LysM repeat protein